MGGWKGEHALRFLLVAAAKWEWVWVWLVARLAGDSLHCDASSSHNCARTNRTGCGGQWSEIKMIHRTKQVKSLLLATTTGGEFLKERTSLVILLPKKGVEWRAEPRCSLWRGFLLGRQRDTGESHEEEREDQEEDKTRQDLKSKSRQNKTGNSRHDLYVETLSPIFLF